jgi:membrane fusion protein (multidrug efflux system)
MMRTLTSVLALGLLLVLGWGAYQWQRTGEVPGLAWVTGGGSPATRASGSVAPAGAGKPAGAANAGAAANRGGGKRPPTVVTVTQAVGRDVEDTVDAVGSLLAAQSVLIKPEIAGRIAEIGVTDGQAVSRGDRLFELDGSVIAAELVQARAELELARSNLRRTKNLASQAFVSERSQDEAQSSVQVLEARRQVVQARLDKTRVRAPFSGVAGLVQVDPGDYVQAGTPLVRLDDLSSLKLDLRVPERLFSRLRPGLPVRVGFDAYPDRVFEAEIETIDAQLDDGGRSVIVRGRIDNSEGLLRPGMFARATLVLGRRAESVMVPEAAVVSDAAGQFVYRVQDGTARRTSVTTGARREGLVEVLGGLNIGDTVVLAGQINLRGAEAPVRIVDPAERSGADSAASG